MGEFSLVHWAIILLIVLVIFGPTKLPGLGKGLGEAIRGFKKGLNEDPPSSPGSADPNRQISSPGQEPREATTVKKDEKIQS